MSRLDMRNRLRALVEAALPRLRVIGMAYTGLIGLIAVVLVVSVAFLPVAPVVTEAGQPAVPDPASDIVPPVSHAVASLVAMYTVLPQPLVQFGPAPEVVLASELPTTVDVAVEDPAEDSASELPVAAEAPAPPARLPAPSRAILTRPAVTVAAVAEHLDLVTDDVPEQAVDALDRASVQQVVLAESPVQQTADAETPRPLAPVPSPTETTRQTKARLEAENQAAIDAAKAARVRTKAEADAANQAAIDAAKAAKAAKR